MIDAGGVNTSGNRNYYGGFSIAGTSLAAGQSIFKPGPLGTLNGAIIDGQGTAVCEGVLATTSKVCNVRVTGLNGGDGFISISADDQITDCIAESLNGGTRFVYVNGTKASGNVGYPILAQDTTDADAVTLNAESGTVVTKTLSTAAGAGYTITVNNLLVSADSRVMVTVDHHGGGAGTPILGRVRPAAGAILIEIINNHAADAFNSTYQLRFQVIN